MAFSQPKVNQLLADCHRRCCICHRFCGVKIEIDHIEQKTDGGSDDIKNGIPVCFECHAEIHSYNDSHPRGRKFRADELEKHKENWLRICRENPAALIDAPSEITVGPLQALIDELQFNKVVLDGFDVQDINAGKRCAVPLSDKQFHRALELGAISVLDDGLRESLLHTYAGIGKLSHLIGAYLNETTRDAMYGATRTAINDAMRGLDEMVSASLELLLKFLGHSKD